MAKRISQSTLNASTLDILNVIRQNASYDYQQNVPVITQSTDIPAVGEIIYGTPAFANQFLNALINRIALVAVKSATFNNPYSILKKGYLEFGETVEEIFVNIAKAVDFTPEKAEAREYKRNIPDVRSAFHTMNWRVMYPITIQDEDLKLAFLSVDGVTNLIGKIVDSVYTAAQYDEFLLFKYMLIKAVNNGKIKQFALKDNTEKTAAKAFRGISNALTFMSSEYNEVGVTNSTPRDRQVIFMDSFFNADFDVEVLSAAFNMDKADFMSRLFLIDNFTTFDNARFDVIRANSTGLEEVTTAELTAMKNVKAILLDEDFFQVYDNINKFTEKYAASGLYWNYFYHTWKTISYSPFANAVVFTDSPEVALPTTLTAHVESKAESEEATILTFSVEGSGTALEPSTYNFIQTEATVSAGIGVQRYGALLIPASQVATEVTLELDLNGTKYKAATTVSAATDVDATVTLNKEG